MKRTQTWIPTKIPNLFILQESGIYYLRVKPKGQRQIRISLKTSNSKIARMRMWEEMLKLGVKTGKGKSGTWGGLVEPWQVWLQGQKVKGKVTDSTIEYKMELLDQVRKTWPNWDRFELDELTEKRLSQWLVAHCKKYAPTRVNGAITALREMLTVAISDKILERPFVEEVLHGLLFVKVDYDYKRMTLELPEHSQVLALRNDIYNRCLKGGSHGGFLFEGLLFSGIRQDSARHMLREDVHRKQGVLYVRKAKYGPYTIPLFPEFLALVGRIEAAILGGPRDRLFPTQSLQAVLTSSCKALGLAHLSHQDLRHIFATRSIEQGVDIPLLASWLGHKDGGKCAMMIYGHIRKGHSLVEASRMRFLAAAGTPAPSHGAEPSFSI